MTKNGCYNRAPLKTHVIVQSGWIYGFNHEEQRDTRYANLEVIPDPMSKTCQYQVLTKDDPKCDGCKEIE
jgi:hypothetical protein